MPGPAPTDAVLRQLTVRGDERGQLVAIEGGIDVPFDIARAYYIYGTITAVERGFHAHRRLRQFAVAISGSCIMSLDNGETRAEFQLDDPAKGIGIEPMIWHEMRDFSNDCVLLVLAEAHFDEADYIRDYDAFLAALRESQ